MSRIQNIPLNKIQAGNNDRKHFDPVALEELAASIKEHGLAQPITLRPSGPDQYEIVAGERRWRACKLLGCETIPALVKEMDDETASAIMLVENTGRADLNPIEEGQAYEARRRRFGWDDEKIARIAGVSVGLVKRRISLLSLVPELQHLVANGHFPLGHAEVLVGLDTNRQRIAARIYRESNGMPLRIFRGVVNQLLEEQSQDALFDLETFWIEQVQQGLEIPRRGKRAIVDVPTRQDLPPVTFQSKDNTASVICQYIAELESQGLGSEAATLGTVFKALVHGNFMSVPD
jgi:ParB/RepB/Spo0J family partition protein